MLISEAFHAYAADVIAMKNQSAKTEENHYICMRALLIHFGDVDITSLSFPLIRDWKLTLDQKRSPETVRNYIIKLRVVLAYCEKQGIRVLNPELIPVPKRRDKVPTYIEKEDVTTLIRAVSKPVAGYTRHNRLRNAAIIATLYASGVRVSELCSMNRLDLHGNMFTVVGKGGKARLCFLDDRALWLIDEYLAERDDNNDALFLASQTNRRLTPGNVQEIFRLASKKAGMSIPVHAHTLRHSFATNLLKNNANMRYVQTMLGHSSLETTQMYTHVMDTDLQRVYNESHTL